MTASADNTAQLWDAVTGQRLTPLQGHASYVNSAAFSQDGGRVVTASADHTGRIWDAVTGEQIAVLEGHTSFVRGAAFSPDGARVVTASGDCTAQLWDAEKGAPVAVLRGHTAEVVGQNEVHFFDRTKPTAEGEPDYISVGTGGKYNLKARRPE